MLRSLAATAVALALRGTAALLHQQAAMDPASEPNDPTTLGVDAVLMAPDPPKLKHRRSKQELEAVKALEANATHPQGMDSGGWVDGKYVTPHVDVSNHSEYKMDWGKVPASTSPWPYSTPQPWVPPTFAGSPRSCGRTPLALAAAAAVAIGECIEGPHLGPAALRGSGNRTDLQQGEDPGQN
eukprot:CAMPEP_0204571910 /NCGR_PEP_ID=MMETSP0661-20131031/39164_1 /ASSEMBLY_ACC=CAM_ASM_000606 /TAXON_ID=109239 /ORGANISM="Alexandrium margalefi, Strain AMGDE01CS-322" /LENGTH=182 /DNA_ID=CAMNT_0051580215 /DNA_START=72 /DNA_END=618 /DNA_ORIENTATION=+